MMNIKLALCGAALLATMTSIAQENIKPLEIGKTIALHSEILNEERVINVLLPADYDPLSKQEYPVVYILDGGVEEDFIHLARIGQV